MKKHLRTIIAVLLAAVFVGSIAAAALHMRERRLAEHSYEDALTIALPDPTPTPEPTAEVIAPQPVPLAPEPEPTTKVCPFCKSEIAIEATRCPHCTSVLEE